jgi:hypothetical protein
LATAATIASQVGLRGFKSHGHAVIAGAGTLPSAALPGAGTSSSAPPTPGSPAPARTGPVSGSGSRALVGQAVQTQYGVVQVKVTVAGSKITNISFVQLTAVDGRSQQINSYAAPILLQQGLQAQSAQIDGVSGATYTSAGYQQSLQSALDQAGQR